MQAEENGTEALAAEEAALRLQGELADARESLASLKANQESLDQRVTDLLSENSRLKDLVYEAGRERDAESLRAERVEAEWRGRLEEASRLMDEIKAARDRDKAQLKRLRSAHRQAVSEAEAAQVACRRAEGALKRKERKLDSLADEVSELEVRVQALKSESGLRIFEQPEVLAWIARAAKSRRLQLPGTIAITGAGFLAEGELVRFLKGRGLRTVHAGDQATEALIAGRDDWYIDDLEEAIRLRQGGILRIYSQELFMLAVTNGRDPLGDLRPDRTTKRMLNVFAAGHPALKYLMESGFEWPLVTGDTLRELEAAEGLVAVQESPIHKLGYRVGLSGVGLSERHRMLEQAFTGALPAVHSARYMKTWGTPGSRPRLRKMARHLAWLARLWRTQSSHRTAVGDWADDLRWMKDEFYEPWMRFRWPHIDV